MLRFNLQMINDENNPDYTILFESSEERLIAENIAHFINQASDCENISSWKLAISILANVDGCREIGRKLALVESICENAPDDAITNIVVREDEIANEGIIANLVRAQCVMAESPSVRQALVNLIEAVEAAVKHDPASMPVSIGIAIEQAQAAIKEGGE